jgi:hypothetical protein
VLVVNRHLGGVGGGVEDLGKGAPVRFDGFGGTRVSDLGGGIVAESTLEVVPGVDVLKYYDNTVKNLLLRNNLEKGTYVD